MRQRRLFALGALVVAVPLLALVFFLAGVRQGAIATFRDYAGLSVYRGDDAKLSALPDPRRIVFLGDSITARWNLASYFPEGALVNRGIEGQTTSQMLLRFHQDVISVHPRAVVILAGSNDIAHHALLEETEYNFAAMAEMAHAYQISVFFASLLPEHESTPEAKARKVLTERPPEKIVQLNSWLKEYCSHSSDQFVDYWTEMADKEGRMLSTLSDDGIHPNANGYTLMRSVLETKMRIEHGHS